MSSRRIRRAAVVLSRLAIAAAFAGPPAAAAPPLPDLSGEWHLNKDVSDDPQQKLRPDSESESGGSGRSGGRGSGGRGGGHGRRGSAGDGGGGGAPGPALFEGRASLTIRHKEPELRITDAAGRERVLYTDGREVQEERSFGGTTKVEARWKDGHIEVTSRPEHGPKTVEAYAIAADGTQLTVTTQIDRRRGSAITIRSVYDPVRPPEKTPAPSEPEDVEITAAGGGAR